MFYEDVRHRFYIVAVCELSGKSSENTVSEDLYGFDLTEDWGFEPKVSEFFALFSRLSLTNFWRIQRFGAGENAPRDDSSMILMPTFQYLVSARKHAYNSSWNQMDHKTVEQTSKQGDSKIKISTVRSTSAQKSKRYIAGLGGFHFRPQWCKYGETKVKAYKTKLQRYMH